MQNIPRSLLIFHFLKRLEREISIAFHQAVDKEKEKSHQKEEKEKQASD